MHVWRMGCVTACDGVWACKCGQRLGCVVTWPPSGRKQGQAQQRRSPERPLRLWVLLGRDAGKEEGTASGVSCEAPTGWFGAGLSPATHERSSVGAPGGNAVRKGWGARVPLQEGVPRPRLPSPVGGRMVGPGQGCGDKRPFLGRVPEVWLPGPTLRIFGIFVQIHFDVGRGHVALFVFVSTDAGPAVASVLLDDI